MAHYHHQAEASYFTGQAPEPHSHSPLPYQVFPPHLPALDGVGALFPSLSTSRKGPQDDTNRNFDDDEAFSPQASPQMETGNATPRADRTAQLHNSPNGAYSGPPSHLTARSTTVQYQPYLSQQELPEFRRQRAAKMKHTETPCKCPEPPLIELLASGSKWIVLAVCAADAPSNRGASYLCICFNFLLCGMKILSVH